MRIERNSSYSYIWRWMGRFTRIYKSIIVFFHWKIETRHWLVYNYSFAAWQISNFLQLYDLHPLVYKEGNYYTIHIGKLSEIYFIFQHLYKDSSYFLKRKYEKFCPLVEKFTRQDSVNSVKGRENHKTEPSSYREGAETLNGTPTEI